MMKHHSHLIVLGAGGHSKVCVDIAQRTMNYDSIAFLDDANKTTHFNLPVLGSMSQALEWKDKADFFVAIGNNEKRKQLQTWLLTHGCHVITLVHPSAIINSHVQLGIGCSVMANVVINSDTIIEDGCILNSSCVIEHDSIIKAYSHLSPGVICGGGVSVGELCWIGIGSVITHGVSIASHCMIGAGGVVISNLTQPGTYVGHPVRLLD